MTDSGNKGKRPETVAIHAGQNPDSQYGSVSPPIYQTSTFRFESPQQGADRFAGKEKGYIYTRMGNPTNCMLEEKIATLEGGFGAMATSSGMAAISTLYFSVLSKGDHMIGSQAMYGPSRMIVENEFSRYGVQFDFINTSDINSVKNAVKDNTKLVFIETPTNPTIDITDIAACAEIAKENKALLAVDNTFMTPILQRPLDHGADIVIHSITKFINGHTDIVGGIIVAKKESVFKRMRTMLNVHGGTMDPHQAWLVNRGCMTLGLRVRKSQENAMIIAERLEGHPKIEMVMYPGLKSHPQYELGRKQSDGFSALISFEIKGGLQAGKTLLSNVNLCTLAVSLGGIETLIQHPASMTHATIPQDSRLAAGITDGLVRMSVGCEHAEDLWEDLEKALENV